MLLVALTVASFVHVAVASRSLRCLKIRTDRTLIGVYLRQVLIDQLYLAKPPHAYFSVPVYVSCAAFLRVRNDIDLGLSFFIGPIVCFVLYQVSVSFSSPVSAILLCPHLGQKSAEGDAFIFDLKSGGTLREAQPVRV